MCLRACGQRVNGCCFHIGGCIQCLNLHGPFPWASCSRCPVRFSRICHVRNHPRRPWDALVIELRPGAGQPSLQHQGNNSTTDDKNLVPTPARLSFGGFDPAGGSNWAILIPTRKVRSLRLHSLAVFLWRSQDGPGREGVCERFGLYSRIDVLFRRSVWALRSEPRELLSENLLIRKQYWTK